MSILKGLLISYVDDFSITVASPSHRGNIHQLQSLFPTLAAKGRDIGVSFLVPRPNSSTSEPRARGPPSQQPSLSWKATSSTPPKSSGGWVTGLPPPPSPPPTTSGTECREGQRTTFFQLLPPSCPRRPVSFRSSLTLGTEYALPLSEFPAPPQMPIQHRQASDNPSPPSPHSGPKTRQGTSRGASPPFFSPLTGGRKSPSRPLRNHLPVDALAHLSLPLQGASHASVLSCPLPHHQEGLCPRLSSGKRPTGPPDPR